LLLRSAEVYPVFSWFIARLCLLLLLLLYVPDSCFSVASHTGLSLCYSYDDEKAARHGAFLGKARVISRHV